MSRMKRTKADGKRNRIKRTEINGKRNETKRSFWSKAAACAACVAICLLSGGCSLTEGNFRLALPEVAAGGDRLSVIFITDKPIEPGTPEIILNSRGELTAREQDPRIYATLNEGSSQTPVSFGGLEGYGIYSLQFQSGSSEPYNTVFADDIFTDLHFTVSGDENTSEASLYVSTVHPFTCYFHPVYQQPDGQVYLLPGSGISSESFEGVRYSQSISESQTVNSQGQEETEGSCFTVTVIAAAPVEETEVFLMDKENQVIGSLSEQQLEALFRKEDSSLQLPDHVAYVILQQTKAETQTLCRSLFDRRTESLEYMVSEEDGYLHSRQLPLVWNADAAPETTQYR